MRKIIALMVVFCISCMPVFAYTDTSGHWAEGYIQQMTDAGYLTGYPDGSFQPDRGVTRGEFSRIICAVYGLPVFENGQYNNFADVADSDWYSGYVPAASCVLPRYADGYFHGDEGICRFEAAYAMLMLHNVYFDGASESAIYMEDYNEFGYDELVTAVVSAVLDSGIMQGQGGKFAPYAILTRAELCTLIAKTVSERGIDFDAEAVRDFIVGADFIRNYDVDETVDTEELEKQVLELVNAEREKAGLNALTWDDDLAEVARAHSSDMAKRGFLDHNNPDGKDPFDRMSEYGIRYSTAGENIAAGQIYPEEVVQSWMSSQGHRENILNPDFGRLGVGFALGGDFGTYWTQCFAD